MSIPEPDPPSGSTPVQVELTVMKDCINALQRIQDDKVALARVMHYLNGRFRVLATRGDQR